MRKQRLMGVGLIIIAGLVLLLACTGEGPEDRDATAALLIAPLGIYMLCSNACLIYDGEPEAKARDRPEPDAWAPTSPGGQSNPLYPYSSPFYQEYGKELQHDKKTSYRGPEP